MSSATSVTPTYWPAKTLLRLILRFPIQIRPQWVTKTVRSWKGYSGCSGARYWRAEVNTVQVDRGHSTTGGVCRSRILAQFDGMLLQFSQVVDGISSATLTCIDDFANVKGTHPNQPWSGQVVLALFSSLHLRVPVTECRLLDLVPFAVGLASKSA